MSKRKQNDLATMLQVCPYPTSEQSRLLITHCQEYIQTVNVLASAIDTDLLFAVIDQVAFASKNLYNAALYLVHQSSIFEGKYLGYNEGKQDIR